MKTHYSISYFIGQAFKGLWRNGVMTLGSVVVLVCCLVVIGTFGVLVVNLNENLKTLDLANEVVVFLEYDATEDDARRVEDKIRALDGLGIGEVRFVSKEDALLKMKEQYSEHSELFETIVEDNNPLAYSYEITVDDVSHGVELQFALENLDDSVRRVNNRMDIAQQIENAKEKVTYAFTFFFAVLFVVCVFVVINTVRNAVYARRDEIVLMRYVGATGWFIATPFVLEGLIIGVVSSLGAYFIESQIYGYIAKMISSDMGIIKIVDFADLDMMVLVGFLSIGVVTGVLGSILTLRRRVDA